MIDKGYGRQPGSSEENFLTVPGWQRIVRRFLAPGLAWLVRAPSRLASGQMQLSQRACGGLLALTGAGLALWLFAGWLVGEGLPFLPWFVFGVTASAVAFALVAGGIALALAETMGWTVRWRAVAAGEALFVLVLACIHLLASSDLDASEHLAVAQQGEGGGLVGWAFSQMLLLFLPDPLAWFVLLLGIAASGWWLWRTLPDAWTASLASALIGLLRNMRVESETPAARPARQAPARPTEPSKRRSTRPAVAPAEEEASRSRAGRSRTEPPAVVATTKTKPVERSEAAERSTKRKARPSSLPPLDLLDPGSTTASGNTDARQQAQILQETLAEFGVPVEVVSIKEGPTVTQFGLEPGETTREMADGEVQRRRVSVNRILRLSNDLALALAAPSLRIEAPVPGRPYVGVEVPNARKSVVALRPVLESRDFAKMNAPLTVALGRDVAGDPVVADLARMPHLLIAGATGSGKSVCINTIIASLLFNNGPETLRLLMVDPKMVELPAYNGIPHLLAPVVTDTSQATGALTWLALQMDERYRLFSQAGVRNIAEFNRKTGKGRQAEMLPHIVLVIDELADLMMVSAYDVERQICRLAQMSRATGIHLVLATQRPSVDVITGLIKANFPARIAFAVASQIDSRVILDTPGAEKLLGRGDMLFMAPDSSKLQRVQGCYVGDREIDGVVNFWRASQAADGDAPAMPQAVPWAGLLEQLEEHDDLLDRAIDLLRGRQQVSTSLLQRQLRLGYPRAARLMEQLEAQGYVGPDEGGGRSRQVLLDEGGDDVDEEEEGEEDFA